MYTQKLIDAGLAATVLFKNDEQVGYAKAIQKIDRIAAQMRKTNPEKYWVDGSAEYRQITDVWQAEREMREVLKKAAA